MELKRLTEGPEKLSARLGISDERMDELKNKVTQQCSLHLEDVTEDMEEIVNFCQSLEEVVWSMFMYGHMV